MGHPKKLILELSSLQNRNVSPDKLYRPLSNNPSHYHQQPLVAKFDGMAFTTCWILLLSMPVLKEWSLGWEQVENFVQMKTTSVGIKRLLWDLEWHTRSMPWWDKVAGETVSTSFGKTFSNEILETAEILFCFWFCISAIIRGASFHNNSICGS